MCGIYWLLRETKENREYREYSGEKGDTYEVTQEDLEAIAAQITSDASSAFNQNVTEKTNDFNDNASNKTTSFNENASEKTGDFNTNAANKTAEFNENAASYGNDISALLDNFDTNTVSDSILRLEDSATAPIINFELGKDTILEQNTNDIVYICTGIETGDYYFVYDGVNYQFTMPTVSAGDVLVFDTENLTLSLNNTQITTTENNTGTLLSFIATPNPYASRNINIVEGSLTCEVSNINLIHIKDYSGSTNPTRASSAMTVSNATDNSFTGTSTGTYSNLGLVFHNILKKEQNLVVSADFLETMADRTSNAAIIVAGSNDNSNFTTIVSRSVNITTGVPDSLSMVFNVGQYDYIRIRFYTNNSGTSGSGLSVVNITNIMLSYDIASGFVAHKGQTYPITLSSGMFLGSLYGRSNYIYGSKDSWFIHKEFDRVVLDGSETWTATSTSNVFYTANNAYLDGEGTTCLSNMYLAVPNISTASSIPGGYSVTFNKIRASYPRLYIKNIDCTTTSDLTTELSTHNTTVYYIMKAVSDTQITDETLVGQLNEIIDNMITYYEGTNLYCTTSHLMPIINLTYRIDSAYEATKQINLLMSNFDLGTSTNSNNTEIINAITFGNQGNLKIGSGPEIAQVVTTGKNMLNTQYAEMGTIDTSGADDPGSNNYNIRGSNYISVLPNTQYTISTAMDVYALRINEYNSEYTNLNRIAVANKSSSTFTTSENTAYVRWSMNYDNGSVSVNSVIPVVCLQLETGSARTSYEPYTNLMPSPTPDIPQKISCFENSGVFDLCNSNLFDTHEVLTTTGTVIYSYNNDVLYVKNLSSGSNRSIYFVFPVQHNKTITISHGNIEMLTGSTISFRYQLYMNKPQQSINFSDGTQISNGSATFNTGDYNYMALVVRLGNGVSGNVHDIMIKYGEASSYISPKHKVYNITLPSNVFLGSLDGKNNYIYGNKDNWKLHYEFGRVVLNGSEGWTRRAAPNNIINVYHNISSMLGTNEYDISSAGIKSDLFLPITYSEYYNGDKEGIARFKSSSGTQDPTTNIYVSLSLSRLSEDSTTAFKAWLAEHNMLLYYPLATETETEINDATLIRQLNNMANNIQTYKDDTVYFTSSDNLSPNLQFDYLIDPLKSIEARLTLLEQ